MTKGFLFLCSKSIYVKSLSKHWSKEKKVVKVPMILLSQLSPYVTIRLKRNVRIARIARIAHFNVADDYLWVISELSISISYLLWSRSSLATQRKRSEAFIGGFDPWRRQRDKNWDVSKRPAKSRKSIALWKDTRGKPYGKPLKIREDMARCTEKHFTSTLSTVSGVFQGVFQQPPHSPHGNSKRIWISSTQVGHSDVRHMCCETISCFMGSVSSCQLVKLKLQPGHEQQIPESTAQAKMAVTQLAQAHVAQVAHDSLSFSLARRIQRIQKIGRRSGRSGRSQGRSGWCQQAGPDICFRRAKATPRPDMFPSHVKSPKSPKSLRPSCFLASFIVRMDSCLSRMHHMSTSNYTHLVQTKHRNHLGQTCADSFQQIHFVHLSRTLTSEATLRDRCVTL